MFVSAIIHGNKKQYVRTDQKGEIMLELKDICFERNDKKILDHINLKLEEEKF